MISEYAIWEANFQIEAIIHTALFIAYNYYIVMSSFPSPEPIGTEVPLETRVSPEFSSLIRGREIWSLLFCEEYLLCVLHTASSVVKLQQNI